MQILIIGGVFLVGAVVLLAIGLSSGSKNKSSQGELEPIVPAAAQRAEEEKRLLQDEARRAAESLAQAQEQLALERKRAAHLGEELARLQEAAQAPVVSAEVQPLKEALAQREKELADAIAALDDSRKQMKRKEEETALLEKDNHALVTQAKELELQVTERSRELAELKAQAPAADALPRAEDAALQKRLQESEAALQEARQQLLAATEAAAAQAQELRQAQDASQSAREGSTRLSAEISSLRDQLASAAGASASQKQLQEALGERDAALQQLQTMRAQEQALQESLREKSGEISRLSDEVKSLNARLVDAQAQQAAQQLASAETEAGAVSQDDYNKLKEKLEAAEKVLRLIHGAG